MEEMPKPRRRWFRFSLQTMLTLVTVVCLYFGWAKNWIRQRREFFATHDVGVQGDIKSPPIVPWQLRLLGERGFSYLEFYTESPAERDLAISLFPEAKIKILPPAPTEPPDTDLPPESDLVNFQFSETHDSPATIEPTREFWWSR